MWKDRLSLFWSQRSAREKGLLAGLTGLFFIMFLYPAVVRPISSFFSLQNQELTDITDTYRVAPDILARYAKLKARRSELENFYSRVDVSANPLSQIERLIRESAKAEPGRYNVNPKEEKQIGGKYIHKTFNVSFQTDSLENVSKFLKDLTTGPQPMLVTRIDLDRQASSGTLRVALEVSGFETTAK